MRGHVSASVQQPRLPTSYAIIKNESEIERLKSLQNAGLDAANNHVQTVENTTLEYSHTLYVFV